VRNTELGENWFGKKVTKFITLKRFSKNKSTYIKIEVPQRNRYHCRSQTLPVIKNKTLGLSENATV
jgi:hypothetical protein